MIPQSMKSNFKCYNHHSTGNFNQSIEFVEQTCTCVDT